MSTIVLHVKSGVHGVLVNSVRRYETRKEQLRTPEYRTTSVPLPHGTTGIEISKLIFRNPEPTFTSLIKPLQEVVHHNAHYSFLIRGGVQSTMATSCMCWNYACYHSICLEYTDNLNFCLLFTLYFV